MNFDAKVKKLRDDMETLKRRIDTLAETLDEAKRFTAKFLDCCQKYDIDTVAINCKSDLVESTRHWPFDYNGSVFADRDRDYGGGQKWPAIWEVVKEMEISGGAGNNGQHQIGGAKACLLIDGVYQLKDGCWIKMD